jgi:hypothetical protein
MSTFTLPTDAIATIPVLFTDQIGRPTAITAGGTVSIDNTAVATAVLSSDGSDVIVTPVAVGTANLVYTNGALATLPLGIVVVTPSASAVSFGPAVIGAPPPAPVTPGS